MLIETKGLAGGEPPASELDVAVALREALSGLEREIRRASVRPRRRQNVFTCRVCAWPARGRTLVIERDGASLASAVHAAGTALRQALEQRLALPHVSGGPRSHVWHASPSPRAGAARLGRTPRERHKRLLFALPMLASPTASLARACDLARRSGSELHVLRVLPELPRRGAAVARDLIDISRELERLRLATRETRALCDEALPERMPELQLAVRVGEFVAEAATRAQRIGAQLIIVPPLSGRSGTLVTALARVSGLPVLVARPTHAEALLMAAADLEDDDSPVLRKAAELASELGVKVVALHDVDNAAPEPALAASDAAGQQRRRDVQRERLSRAARRWLPSGHFILTHESDPARAIVKQAGTFDVDTIVVGAKPRSWFARLVAKSVAARVVETADRSVLVVPVETPELPGGVASPAASDELH